MYKSIDNSQIAANRALEIEIFTNQMKQGVWCLGVAAWIFASLERAIAIFSTSYLHLASLTQLFPPILFLLTWLFLKPEVTPTPIPTYFPLIHTNESQQLSSDYSPSPLKLKKFHLISQEYILPFSYLCQIYHLLNLKHLETIHRFSLNHLQIVSVTHTQPTRQGGKIKFTTVLNSPWNPLRIWRQPIVEVDLTLHNPYTVELSIPVYNHKRITVMFNVLPLTEKEHYFFIDIYSDLQWFRPFLQIILHFAACLTLFEDLSYLKSLQQRQVQKLFQENQFSQHQNMWLYRRFVEVWDGNV